MKEPNAIEATPVKQVPAGLSRIGIRQEYALAGPDMTPGPARPWVSIIGGQDTNTGGRFVPNLNISRPRRFGGEDWLNVNHRSTVVTIERPWLEKGRLTLKKGDVRHCWYERLDANGAVEVEWEMTWKGNPNPPGARVQDPPWYRVEFDLDYPLDLRFSRQGDDSRLGTRPDRVKGSYAVYGPSGKFLHIYRPEIMDASGKRSWCGLQVNETDRTMTVLINQAWLDHAIYPVTLDPTYGHTSIGASPSTANSGDFVITSIPDTMPTDGALYKLYTYCSKASGSPTMNQGLYTTANPRVLLDSAPPLAITSGTLAWYGQEVATGVKMSSGTAYGVGMLCLGGSLNARYDDPAAGYFYAYWSGQGSLPASINTSTAAGTWGDLANTQYAMYVSGWIAGHVNKIPNYNLGSLNRIPRANIASVNRLA